jgi:hypothetical protein
VVMPVRTIGKAECARLEECLHRAALRRDLARTTG